MISFFQVSTKWPITYFPLPISHHPQPITYYPLPIFHFTKIYCASCAGNSSQQMRFPWNSWLLGRPTYHIGASGVVYGLAFFLIFFGMFKKDFKSLFISIVILFFYGGLFYGVLPNQPGISWESHLLGGIAGTGSAIYFGKMKNR